MRDWSLITGGGGATKREGGHVKFDLYKRGGGGKSFSHAVGGGHNKFHASYSWSGPQLPKCCGFIGILSPMHKKFPDSYSKREGGNPGNSGLLSQQ